MWSPPGKTLHPGVLPKLSATVSLTVADTLQGFTLLQASLKSHTRDHSQLTALSLLQAAFHELDLSDGHAGVKTAVHAQGLSLAGQAF